ncbi:transposase [Streptomyces sp. NPDC056930]|uniref:transposase n=1 Tax=Streptomyces sp. NPDC056930 TaxID=3345967 RepID=UPI003643468D
MDATAPDPCPDEGPERGSSHAQPAPTALLWRDYRDLLIAAHRQLGGPIVLVWGNLNVHKAADLREWAAAQDWLTIYYLPPYAPDLNPVEGIWSLLRRGWLSNVAFGTPEHFVQTIRRGLRHIQYRSHLIDGCLTETGLTISP